MKYGITFALVFACALVAEAAPPSDQSINEMMNVMQLEGLLNQALKQMDEGIAKGMEQGLEQATKGKELSPAQKTAVENFRKKFSATMSEELSLAKVKSFYVQAYRDSFTQEEVNAIITFYKSPAGKAIVDKNPTVMAKAGALTQVRIDPLTQKLRTMQEEFVRELSKTK
ncbi:MAG: DUF2059 domain-containing protein [Verrucomicrobiota bacterium]|nr:DUF2059 domain-containing protein [Verrucomicrobiota bacterium]